MVKTTVQGKLEPLRVAIIISQFSEFDISVFTLESMATSRKRNLCWFWPLSYYTVVITDNISAEGLTQIVSNSKLSPGLPSWM